MVKLVPISGRMLCKILEKLGFETTEFHQSMIGGMSSARKPSIIGGIPSIKNHAMS